MIRFFLCSFFFFTLIFLGSPFCGYPQNGDEERGVKKYGVVQNIAEDRRVEKIGGTYEPEGLDKYLKRKLDELNKDLSGQIQDLQNRIDHIESQTAEIKALLKEKSAKSQKSNSIEEASP